MFYVGVQGDVSSRSDNMSWKVEVDQGHAYFNQGAEFFRHEDINRSTRAKATREFVTSFWRGDTNGSFSFRRNGDTP